MIYATCTFSPEENEEVVDFLLNRYENAEIVPVSLPIENIQSGITEWEDKKYSDEVKNCVRILPKDAYSGFFFTKIKKLS
jgi:16S rRNA C967 or C1407 C5-methylase (RsmB/RsmF family)